METTNFSFLKKYEPLFFQLATTAEKAFSADPNTTLLKLRQLGEALAQDVACRIGLDVGECPTQHELLYQINDRGTQAPLLCICKSCSGNGYRCILHSKQGT